MHDGDIVTIIVFWITDHREYLQWQHKSGELMILIKVALEGMKVMLISLPGGWSFYTLVSHSLGNITVEERYDMLPR